MSRRIIWPKIFLYGDSLTERSFSQDGCWGSLLADAFCRKADIVPRGFSGYNTKMCRDLLPYVASELNHVVAATVLLGSNDASVHGSSQQIGLEEYKENLQKIIQHFQMGGVKSVIVITPPALDSAAWYKCCEGQGNPIGWKTEKLTAMYAEACYKVATDMDTPCVDLHTAMLQQENWQTFLSDGLHFSEKGSKFLFLILLPVLQVCLNGHIIQDRILPNWKDVNTLNPEQSFDDWSEQNCGH